MLVYLKMMLFTECNMKDHYMCTGALIRADGGGSKHVHVCTCTCHETESVVEDKQLRLPLSGVEEMK